MGKFSNALAKGRDSAREERQKKKHHDDADTARRLAGVLAALKWTDQVVYPVVQKANADLEESDLVVNYDGGPTDVGAEATLTVSKTGMPRLTLVGPSKQPRSIAFKVCAEGLVCMSLDGKEAEKLGNLSQVTSDKIEGYLVTMLTEIGRDLDSLQAAEAAKPEIKPETEGMIALAVVRSPAVRAFFDRFAHR